MDLVRKAKATKILKNPFLHDGFLNLNLGSIFVKFWHSINVKDYMYSVLVGRYMIFQYFLVKSDLCPFRSFRLHSSEKDAEYQNNH